MKRFYIFVFLGLECACNGMLDSASMQRANCERMQFKRCSLKRANLSEANLTGAQVIGSDLTEANLSGANLVAADFFGSKLINVNLAGCFIATCKVCRADGTLFKKTSFKGAFVDQATLQTLPDKERSYVEKQAILIKLVKKVRAEK